MKRYFEFIGSDGKTEVDHSKFWEIWVDGTTLRTRYGKIGANGQTTLKNFDSVADAETAMGKAIVEKTKKGYVEPSLDELDDEDDEEREIAPKLDENDPEAVAALKAYASWEKKYKPLAYIEFELEVAPAGIPDVNIWSIRSGDYEEYLSKGFQEYNPGSNSPVTSYVIAEMPIKDMDVFETITTEIRRWCDKCEGEGEFDGDDCDYCESAGTQYFEVASNYPLFISTQEELDDFASSFAGASPASSSAPAGSTVKFCSECGTKREPLTAKFCGECGTGF